MTSYQLSKACQVFSLVGSNLGLMCLKCQNWYHSLALLPWAPTYFQNGMTRIMCLLCSSDYGPWKVDTLKIAWGGVEGRRMVPKLVPFGGLRELVIGAIVQNVITSLIFGIRSWFLEGIKAETKGVSHKKLISKSDFFQGVLLTFKKYGKVSKFTSWRCEPEKKAKDGTG